MAVRKITKTTKALLLNLKGFLPPEWNYVIINVIDRDKDRVVIELRRVE